MPPSSPSKFYLHQILNPTTTPSTPYAIVILNQPINTAALSAILPSAALIVCADGGANRYHNYETNSTPSPRNPTPTYRLPDAIIGDCDSLSPTVESHYRSKSVPIIKDPDQYSTDFTKCLRYLRRHWDEKHGSDSDLDVVALGGLGGRVDQGFSQIHHLYMTQNDRTMLKGRIFLLSEQSLSFILDDGVNEIYVGRLDESGKRTDVFEENVGIIPVMGPARISTEGLEWDVEDWETEFGGQVSTSNHLRSEKVVVDVRGGKRVLFTLELVDSLCLGSRS